MSVNKDKKEVSSVVKPSTSPSVAAPVVKDAFADVDNQKVGTEAVWLGIYTRGAVERYEYDGKTGHAGFVQILQKAREDSLALDLHRIKVLEPQFGLIDLLNKSFTFKQVELRVLVSEGYNKKMTVTLHEDQPLLKAS